MTYLENLLRPLTSRALIYIAFGILIAMMLSITGVRLHQLDLTAQQIEQVVNNHMVKIKYAAIMRYAARERTLGLHRMILTGDLFSRDEQWLKFNRFGGEFARARLKILSMVLNDDEKAMLELQGRLTREALDFQDRVIELIEQGQMDTARRVLERGAIPAQDKVLHQLTLFYDYQGIEADRARTNILAEYRSSKTILISLAVGFVLISLVLLRVVASMIKHREKNSDHERKAITSYSQVKSQLMGNIGLEFEDQLMCLHSDIESTRDLAEEQRFLSKDLQRLVNQSVSKIDQLTDFSEKIIELAKLETGYLTFLKDEVRVCQLVEEVISEVEPFTIRNNNSITVNCHNRIGIMYTDQKHLKAILLCLVSNACAHTEYGMISLNVKRDNQWLYFRIEDTGVGISEEKLSTVFDVFHPDHDQTAMGRESFVLNLGLSRRVCQLMGGDISVESEENIGSACIVQFPVTYLYRRKG
ncbi:MAG: ATP-binding protein [Thiohalomonadales bacterium]